jgi:hypothetical protein
MRKEAGIRDRRGAGIRAERALQVRIERTGYRVENFGPFLTHSYP